MYPCSDSKSLIDENITAGVIVYNETSKCDLCSVAPRKYEHVFCTWVVGNDLQCEFGGSAQFEGSAHASTRAPSHMSPLLSIVNRQKCN